MSDALFSHRLVTLANGARVNVAFTSAAAGNLGLHVGSNLEQTLSYRQALESTLLGEEASCGFSYLNQVHGTVVFDADVSDRQGVETEKGLSPQEILDTAPVADAAVSREDRPLAIMVADCIPLVFVGEHAVTGRPVLGVAHAGRRGLLDGVIQRQVEAMAQKGAENIQAWTGPSICGRCYEVPEAMRQESAELIPQVYSTTSWGTPGLDLPAGARAVLAALPQVTRVHSDLAACTFENEHLFSHRGHTQRQEPAGRIAGLVWVEASPLATEVPSPSRL
ncbi:laccase domain-containing protein [Rothia nasimurium]|uniref:Laccase domain-containing protein n=1 Tax=Rothia nasimurium TaxID=85336 RepID=A0A4Y9F6K5_9MICC|nr:polyphenol oxidase family protein [Rothia nasimurium]MBF0807442.1 laccase domain-containing protein [Rothia nasimurium]TFU23740.1 laccase domain-containing protein [Rothia nasimurium]